MVLIIPRVLGVPEMLRVPGVVRLPEILRLLGMVWSPEMLHRLKIPGVLEILWLLEAPELVVQELPGAPEALRVQALRERRYNRERTRILSMSREMWLWKKAGMRPFISVIRRV